MRRFFGAASRSNRYGSSVRMRVLAVAVLLAGFGSPDALTVAVLVSVRPLAAKSTLATSVTVVLLEGSNVPRLQVVTSPALVQVGDPGTDDTKVVAAGA